MKKIKNGRNLVTPPLKEKKKERFGNAPLAKFTASRNPEKTESWRNVLHDLG